MKRHTQTLEELLSLLSPVDTTWMDDHSTAVIGAMSDLPIREAYGREDIARLLTEDFDVGITLIRLVLGMSKDEFHLQMRGHLKGRGGLGITRFRKDQAAYLDALDVLGVCESLTGLVHRKVDWKDLLSERLRYGRGSAIKGQKRGRGLEDAVEQIVSEVFGRDGYDARCRFVGSDGKATEKTDFAIPDRGDPRILIECKAYGATGSKQTDILGDIQRIVTKKRSDTNLLLVTDGISWRLRRNDLQTLVSWQQEGQITRIYTQQMATDLENDLKQLRDEHQL